MDLERAMEFILEQHAKTEAILADVAERQKAAELRQEAAERRQEAADRRMDRFERNLTRVANLGMRARNDLKRRAEEAAQRAAEHEKVQAEMEKWRVLHEARMARLDETMQEIGEKLNGLIGYVDHLPKDPPPAEPKG
jgi:hypothetical protein